MWPQARGALPPLVLGKEASAAAGAFCKCTRAPGAAGGAASRSRVGCCGFLWPSAPARARQREQLAEPPMLSGGARECARAGSHALAAAVGECLPTEQALPGPPSVGASCRVAVGEARRLPRRCVHTCNPQSAEAEARRRARRRHRRPPGGDHGVRTGRGGLRGAAGGCHAPADDQRVQRALCRGAPPGRAGSTFLHSRWVVFKRVSRLLVFNPEPGRCAGLDVPWARGLCAERDREGAAHRGQREAAAAAPDPVQPDGPQWGGHCQHQAGAPLL